MKKSLCILTVGLLTIFMSCGYPNEKKNTAVIEKDTALTKLELKKKKWLEKKAKMKEQNKVDSLRLDKVLTDALRMAVQNIKEDKFQKEYEVMPNNEYNMKVELNMDRFFTKNYPHLIIRRHGPNALYIDIYAKSDNKFEKVVSHEQWMLTYVNDTIKDINGDGLKDFVVNWYGASGCCLKAFSNIYLLREDKKTFSNSFEFVNPTFSPREKVIRGVCYGHPGETQMYKYKWNGERIDTLEFIYFDKNKKGEKTGKIVISKKGLFQDKEKDRKLLNRIPDEYKNIEGYDWFIGKL
jgi:hypothetical protein